jgi:ABC-type transport system involved in multi-copper enzyme maturation permease subunit
MEEGIRLEAQLKGTFEASMLHLYWITLRQLLRQSALWWLNLFVIAFSEIAPAFAEVFCFGKVEQAIVDCSTATVYLAVLLSVVTTSYQLLAKEFNERVALTLFTKPLSLLEILLAKYFALLTTLFIIAMVQGLMILKHAYTYELSHESWFSLATALYAVFLQGLILQSLGLMFSCRFHGLSSLYLTLGMILLGQTVPPYFLSWTCFFIPGLQWYDLSYWIYNNHSIPMEYLANLSLYAIAYSGLMVVLGSYFLDKREF